MAFYDLSKPDRVATIAQIENDITAELSSGVLKKTVQYFCDEDTYIRKSAYLAIGKIYKDKTVSANKIISILKKLARGDDPKIRQTTVNAAGEIGKSDFILSSHFLTLAYLMNIILFEMQLSALSKKWGRRTLYQY